MEKNIDIKKIMSEIRADIEDKKIAEILIDFESVPMPFTTKVVVGSDTFDLQALDSNISYLNNNYLVQAYRPLKSRPVIGRFIIFVKKVLRKSIKFYIEPIVNDQNEINASIVRSLNEIRAFIEEQKREQTEQGDDILPASRAEKEIAVLKKRIAILEAENAILKQTL